MIYLFQLVVSVAPICLVGWFVQLIDWRRKTLLGERRPMEGDLLLRGPGEYLREKRSDLHFSALGYWSALLAVSLASQVLLYVQFAQSQSAIAATTHWTVLLAVAVQFFCVIKCARIVLEARRFELGLQGEIAVAQELNQFLRQGCYVFHDVPEKTIGNIDHVIVASTGIFVIETKTRRKRRATGHEGKIEYDGQFLRFPDGFETNEPIQQARRNAAWLRKTLSSELAEEIPVRAIVCYPGWYIKDGPNEAWDVKVRNPSRINNVVINERSKLTPEQMKRVERWLDRRCRDVEF